ncbi:hypothetical protein JYK00_02625 [Thermosipho ferrireducens]|uniref:Uncharacterized protein n=1 Tax=Thermosipho ferrireducens TaxID=2571116 RepID=A0ABX7S912_9BACT|nr:hypothetical protein [Thermosipho ferrireducens]QTA38438.1 hypothetical protein JYK00_02625 [Thermosipho ferrireducens]
MVMVSYIHKISLFINILKTNWKELHTIYGKWIVSTTRYILTYQRLENLS